MSTSDNLCHPVVPSPRRMLEYGEVARSRSSPPGPGAAHERTMDHAPIPMRQSRHSTRSSRVTLWGISAARTRYQSQHQIPLLPHRHRAVAARWRHPGLRHSSRPDRVGTTRQTVNRWTGRISPTSRTLLQCLCADSPETLVGPVQLVRSHQHSPLVTRHLRTCRHLVAHFMSLLGSKRVISWLISMSLDISCSRRCSHSPRRRSTSRRGAS